MIFIDTSYLLALLNSGDSLNARAVAWSRVIEDRLLITEYVLVEAVDGLSAPIERPAIHQMVESIRARDRWHLIPASSEWFDAGLKLHADRADKYWSLTDCISFAVMQQFIARRALTYDHHFEQAGFEALLRRDPPI